MNLLQYLATREMRELEVRRQKEAWELEKEKNDMALKHQKMINDSVEKAYQAGILSENQVASIMMDPKGPVATLWGMGALGGQNQLQFTPESTPESPDVNYGVPTGKYLPKQQQPGLVDQIATGQLGMSPQDIFRDLLKKETGIGESVEPVKTEPMLNPNSGQMEFGQILRNGQVRFTGQAVPPEIKWEDAMGPNGIVYKAAYDKHGNRQPKFDRTNLPQEITWKEAMGKQGVIQEAYDKFGNRMPQYDRTNIPQETQKISGTMPGTNLPAEHIVPKVVPPGFEGLAVPQAVKGTPVTITGPQNQQSTALMNEFTGGLMGGGGRGGVTTPSGNLPGIPTKPAQPVAVGVAQQTEMLKSGFNALEKVKSAIFDATTGKINRKNLANAKVGTPWTEGKRIGDLIGSALNAVRIASTGAAFSPKELEELKSQYIPNVLANDQQIYEQWDQMANFLQGMLGQMDPNQVYTKEQQSRFGKLANVPRPKAPEKFKKGQTIEKNGKIYKYIGNDQWEKQ